MIQKKFDLYVPLLALVTVLMGLLVFSRISGNGYFYIAAAGDTYNQYIHFFNMFHDLVRSGEMPFWSWTYGLGGSFWNDFGYYMLGDIFIWPLLLFPKSWFLYTFIPITILKLFLISLGTYLLLKKIGVKRGIAMTAGIANSFALFNFDHFYTHYFFLNATVYFPFILLGYERFLRDRKPGLLFVTLFLASISNFYFLFMITIGLFFYSLFRYFTYEKTEKNLKAFFLYHLKLSVVYLLALGTAMVVFLPSVISLFQSNALHRPDQPILDKFLSFDEVVGKLFWQGGISFIPFVVIPLLFINGIKRHFIYGLMGIVLFAIIAIQDINSLIAGFSSPFEFRALFIYNLLFIVISAIVLNDIDLKKAKNIVAIFFLSIWVYIWLDQNPFTHYADIIKFLPIVFSILLIAARFIRIKTFKITISSLAAFAVILYSLLLPYSLATDLVDKSEGKEIGDEHKGVWGVLPLMDNEKYNLIFDNPTVKDTLHFIEEDQSLYRMNITDPGILGNNSSMTYEYNTYVSYQSLLKWSLQHFEMDFLGNPGSRRINVINGYPNNTIVNTILNSKYNISIDGSKNMYGYETIHEKDNVEIGKNRNALPIGFLYNSAISASEFDNADFAEHDELMLRNAVISNSDFEKMNLETDEETSVQTVGAMSQADFSQNTKVEKQKDGVLVESDSPIELTMPVEDHPLSELTVYADILPYTKDKGITLSASNNLGANFVFEKNMKYNQYNIYQYHYTDTIDQVLFRFGMDQETEWIKLVLQPGKFLLKDIRVSVSDYEAYEELTAEYQSQSLRNVDYGNNYINGSYSAEKNSILFFSIPFSSGWKASIDGKEVDTFPVHSAFTGIEAPEGEHKVKLRFTPEGFKAGLVVSIISLLLAILLFIKTNSRRKNN